jgi:uncharacterized heparinase superfamily protein
MESHHQGAKGVVVSVISRLRGWLRSAAVAPAPAAIPEPPPEKWDDQFPSPEAAASWVDQRRAGGRLYADLSEPSIDELRRRWPQRVTRTIAAAERVIAHEFDLLGSGRRVIADPDRPVTTSGYRPIDWVADPIARLRFPQGFAHREWNPSMTPGRADIKWPWEIGRCQHWVTLGQAFRFTKDERYAREIVEQHADFMAANPIGTGVQFVCTMDVAIRAMNWAIAFELIRESRAAEAVMLPAYRSLFDLGAFIERNLENKYEVTSNHFLSNVAGLFGLAMVFRDVPAGARWLSQCRAWFEQEMRVQVLPDGADYESSIPYHRLVVELFLSGARLAQLDGTPLSSDYLASLRRMLDFMTAVERPDGLMPQVGDADDGRLHIFTDYGTWQPQDARHLGGAAAAVFQDWSWRAPSGDDDLWECAWWGGTIAEPPAAPRAAMARTFPEAGVIVAREPNSFLLVTNGRVGTNGFGNHKHNDLLSFEFHADGAALIVDPGSYVYTSNPDERNRFRATAYHNTLRIDGSEQNDLRLDYLFRMFETSKTEHVRFENDAQQTSYVGRHTGYERLSAGPVTHEREFQLKKARRTLLITDRLTGSGRHTLAWHFHLAPGVAVPAPRPGRVELVAGGAAWAMDMPRDVTIAVTDAWYSPSYGVRVPCTAIDLTATLDVAASGTFQFAIAPIAGEGRR